MKVSRKKAFTMVELVVVILILSLLASIAMGVYTQYVRRAEFAAAAVTISDLSVAIERYEVDLGSYPPSSSTDATAAEQWVDGCDNLVKALRVSMSGDPANPGTARWRGPYFGFKDEQLGTQVNILGFSTLGVSVTRYSLLDPWDRPYNYISSSPVSVSGVSGKTGYTQFSSAKWGSSEPFASEIYINPSTFQIFSLGPDGITGTTTTLFGRDTDDVNNF